MLLGGKFLKPISSWGFVHRENLINRIKSPITLIQAPAGYLLTESLAAILEEGDQKIIWLRFGWEDFDPGTCLLSLIKAFQVVNETAGAETLKKMSKYPGPLQGWQALFAQLGREIEACIPEPAFLVLENMQYFSQSPLTLALLIKHFLPALPNQMRVILVSQKDLPGYSLPRDPEIVHPEDLKLSPTAIKQIFQPMGLISDKECIRQAVRLMTGSPVGLTGIYMVGQLLGEDYVQDVLQRHTTRAGLCNQIALDWLSTLDEQDVRTMATLSILRYNHPTINQSQTGKGLLARSPWTQELDRGWIRPHRLWLNSIRTALRTNPYFSALSVQTAAYYLCQSGFYVTGIELLFASKAFTHAAEYLAENVDQMLNLGQWELLKYWLDRLPDTILQDQPRLLHASGEIKSTSGDLVGATQDFQLANELYFRKNDNAGKVISLLALSTLATHLDDAGEVWASAYKALQIAQSEALPELESSAELQVGILTLQAGDVQQALLHLERAGDLARTAGDASMSRRIDDLRALALEHEKYQHQRKQQHQNYMAAQQAEQAHLEHLQQVIRLPLDQDAPDWGSMGWLQAPLMLKLGGAVLTNGHVLNGKESLWGKISTWLRRGQENGHFQKEDEYSSEVSESLENWHFEHPGKSVSDQVAPPSQGYRTIPQQEDWPESLSPPSSDDSQPLEAPVFPPGSISQPKPPPSYPSAKTATNSPSYFPETPFQLPTTSSTQKVAPSMVVYCLGPFWIYLDEQPVIEWPSSKGKSIFQYLVTYRKRPVVKEVLMEIFWPEAPPDAARNNLNVAIYGLRQALRQVQPSFSHLLFQDDSYLLNPELQVWVDYEAYTDLLNSARTLERQGDIDKAMRRYCAAEAMYQGEFMEEERYDDWPIPLRQQLQNEYLNLLNQLIGHYFDHEDYLACTTMCHKMLAIDPYREEAHRYLMRCYLRQGHPHLALRQYHLCVKMLREELNITPTPETNAIYEQIRQSD